MIGVKTGLTSKYRAAWVSVSGVPVSSRPVSWIPWLQLLATATGPLIAALVVVHGWGRSHKDAEARGVSDWRRSELAETTSKFLEVVREVEKPTRRQDYEIDDDMKYHITLINNLVISQVYSERIATLRNTARRYLSHNSRMFKNNEEEAMSEGNQIQMLHEHIALVSEQLMVELGLKEQQPAPEGHAYVVGQEEDPALHVPKLNFVKRSTTYKYLAGITHPDKPWKSNPFKKHHKTSP